MAERVKVAVVGTGSLGRHHARIYAELAEAGEVEFVGVHDVSPETAARFAEKYQVRHFPTLDEARQAADAFSVVTPTTTHFDIASQLMDAGKHVLVEKPITDRPDQAATLVSRAQEKNCLLQVGHVERFNPVFNFLTKAAQKPRFIEAHRLSPYPARSTDIGVVLDLMIHDLDIVMAFVNSPVARVDSVGIPVLSQSEDIANVRLRFENGCVANVTASRVSAERLRKIRVFSEGDPQPSYVSLDYMRQEGYIYRLADEDAKASSLLKKLLTARHSTVVSEFGGKKIVREPVPIKQDEPLKLELTSFIQCVREKQTPVVCGEAGKRALDLALEITRQIEEQ